MKIKLTAVLFVLQIAGFKSHSQQNSHSYAVPLGGNSFLTKKAPGGKEEVTNAGWINWQHTSTIFSTYIYLTQPGTLQLSAHTATVNGNSTIACTINGIKKSFSPNNKEQNFIGEWKITKPGYIKIDMQGIRKSGNVFAQPDNLFISGTALSDSTAFVKNNEGNYFYWGRRGPSVHLNYDLSAVNGDIEWFYNEITVPKGNDIIGSYFMANGFAEGYFGMQVNSPTERRILFSVWSPFNTDDPSQIPEDKKIKLLQKGTGVHTGEFGNEGSGGQSYMQYNWKAGETCKFLIHAQPAENNYTNYTAYFYAAEKKQWLLLASFSRPATHTYLTRLHSFLENFEPETGYITRSAQYSNQWVKTAAGEWKPICKASFTYDATAKKGYRLDYNGSLYKNNFVLRNCGFFNLRTPLKTIFTRNVTGTAPVVDLNALLKQ